MKVILDIEANGLLDSVTKIHCMSLRDAESGILMADFADQPEYKSIQEGLKYLENCETIVGHNLQGYDLPALKKVLGYEYKGEVHDTLVMCRLAYPNLFDKEISSNKTAEVLGYRHGSHSLKAWGVRLNELKGDFGADEEIEKAFEVWTPEMQEYMNQDTRVNWVLYKHLLEINLSPVALKIEHDFNRIIQQQITNGIGFDYKKATELSIELKAEVEKLERWASQNVAPKIIKLKTKEKSIPFNMGSTKQVAEYFIAKYNWKPKYYTPSGAPQVTGDILASLEYPEAKIFAQYYERQKILGFLTEGKNAWLNSQKNGRIHGYVNSNGAVTGRVLMSKPNASQVPSRGAYKGVECRSLFIASEGMSLVDADASGLELRTLAHYMYPYDNGEYCKAILDSDIHKKNQEAAGLETRDQAKTMIYALVYGAGLEKLGSIVKPDGLQSEKVAIGKALKNKFYSNIPALKELTYDVQRSFESKGYLKAIDGRVLMPREAYKSLNTLLQSAGAIAVKQANIIAIEQLNLQKIEHKQVLFVHDEIVIETPKGNEEAVGKILIDSFKTAGELLKLKIPLTGEFKYGNNWGETH